MYLQHTHSLEEYLCGKHTQYYCSLRAQPKNSLFPESNTVSKDSAHLWAFDWNQLLPPFPYEKPTVRREQTQNTYWKNLNPLTTPPLLENNNLRSSSVTEGLKQKIFPVKKMLIDQDNLKKLILIRHFSKFPTSSLLAWQDNWNRELGELSWQQHGAALTPRLQTLQYTAKQELSLRILTEYWTDEEWQKGERCFGNFWSLVSWNDVEEKCHSPWSGRGPPGSHGAAALSGAWTAWYGSASRGASAHSSGSWLQGEDTPDCRVLQFCPDMNSRPEFHCPRRHQTLQGPSASLHSLLTSLSHPRATPAPELSHSHTPQGMDTFGSSVGTE